MALPGDLTTITVTGTYLDGAGNPQGGTVTFTPSSSLTDQTGKIVLAKVSTVVQVSSSTGTFSVSGLACTDNANLVPAGWAWVVSVNIAGASQTFNTYLPSGLGTTVDISALAPFVVAAVPPLPQTGTITPGTAAGGDLSGTYPAPQVFQVHLAKPLPVSQGGTGVTSGILASLNGVPLTAAGQQQLYAERSQALTPWYAGLANRQFARCNVVCLGDSITEGQHASGPPQTGFENRWLARLRDLIRAANPTPGLAGGGRGFIGVEGTGETSFTWPATVTGTPGAVSEGPKAAGLQLNASGQSISFSLNGDSADIMWEQVAFGGTFSWSVDGGAATNISTNGSGTVDGKITHISLGTAGAHTLLLSWVSGNSNVAGVVEYNGDFSLGIQVHDAGHFGWNTGSWLTPLGTGAAGPAAAIAALQPSCIVISLGVNDQFINESPATFQANLQQIITDLKGQLTPPYPSFILNMYPPRSGQSGYTFSWAQYVNAAYNVAAADTSGPLGNSLVTVMDFTLGPRMPGADTDAYGLWQAGDNVHPSNKGHQYIADMLLEFMLPA